MAATQEFPVGSPSNSLLSLARRLGRSPIFRPLIQVLAALLVLAMCMGLAVLACEYRDEAAQILAMLLLFTGFQFAWRCLPFSTAVRDRLSQDSPFWQRDDEPPGGSWTRVFRNLGLFALIGLAANIFDHYWKTGILRLPTLAQLIYAGIFITIAVVAHLLERRSRKGR